MHNGHTLLIGTYCDPNTGLYYGTLTIVGTDPLILEPPYVDKAAALTHARESFAAVLQTLQITPIATIPLKSPK